MKIKLINEALLVTILITVLILTSPSNSSALDVTANSCSRDDVDAAVTMVENAGGGIVYIPDGDCTWDSSVQEVDVDGNVSIIGQGSNRTILRRDKDDFFIEYNGSGASSNYIRVSGIAFYGNNNIKALGIKLRNVYSFQIDNCIFEGVYRYESPIDFKSATKGLIHDCTFINPNVGSGGSYYGVTAGSPYSGGIPSDVCDKDVCTCWAGDKDAGDESSSVSSGNTVISSDAAVIDNSGGAGQGKVRRIYVQIDSVDSNPTINVASFSRSENIFTARACTTNLPVSVGKNVFTVEDGDFTAFDIHNGDYLGVYLTNCSQDVASGSSGWSVSGDKTNQSGVDFGSPDVGNVAIGAEIFDNEGDYESCESNWNDWYDDVGDGRPSYDGFNENFDPNTDKAIYIEDCTISWYKSSIMGNWGNSHAFVIRHNTFNSSTGTTLVGMKAGTVFGMIHDNIFTYTSGPPNSGYAIRGARSSGLIYNNTFANYISHVQGNGFRSYSDYYYPPQTRMDELYIYDNNFTNMSCSDDENCFGGFNSCSYCALVGAGENGTLHFRAPKAGERLYNFTEYPYPHPLRSGASVPDSPEASVPDSPKGLSIILINVTVPETATEGDGVLADQGTVSVFKTLSHNLTVSLSSDDTSEVTVPSSVIIPAGSLTTTFDLTIVDDAVTDGTQSVTVTGSATEFPSASDTISVLDNDGSEIVPPRTL